MDRKQQQKEEEINQEQEKHLMNGKLMNGKLMSGLAYFSCTGTTENAAEYAAELLGADLFRIQAEDPYTGGALDYTDSTSRSSIEKGDDTVRPAVSGSVEETERYDVIYLGYPIWHGQAMLCSLAMARK